MFKIEKVKSLEFRLIFIKWSWRFELLRDKCTFRSRFLETKPNKKHIIILFWYNVVIHTQAHLVNLANFVKLHGKHVIKWVDLYITRVHNFILLNIISL